MLDRRRARSWCLSATDCVTPLARPGEPSAYGGVFPVIVRCIWINHLILARCTGITAFMSVPVIARKRLRSCRTESTVAGQMESVAMFILRTSSFMREIMLSAI